MCHGHTLSGKSQCYVRAYPLQPPEGTEVLLVPRPARPFLDIVTCVSISRRGVDKQEGLWRRGYNAGAPGSLLDIAV